MDTTYLANHTQGRLPAVTEVREIAGRRRLCINCTQLGDSFTPQYKTAKQKRAVLDEWCEFLRAEPGAFDELHFGTRMPQELFDAVCAQCGLTRLRIKWGAYSDLSALENLRNLTSLSIGSGSSVQSIEPIAKLTGLKSLAVENFQKIKDYAALANLTELESLSIEGDGLAPKFIYISSLEFLRELTGLKELCILAARLESKDYSPVLCLRNLEFLTLPSQHGLYGLYDEIAALPRLKSGLVKEKPEIYLKRSKNGKKEKNAAE